jgi:hypothetical protein
MLRFLGNEKETFTYKLVNNGRMRSEEAFKEEQAFSKKIPTSQARLGKKEKMETVL